MLTDLQGIFSLVVLVKLESWTLVQIRVLSYIYLRNSICLHKEWIVFLPLLCRMMQELWGRCTANLIRNRLWNQKVRHIIEGKYNQMCLNSEIVPRLFGLPLIEVNWLINSLICISLPFNSSNFNYIRSSCRRWCKADNNS